MSEVEEQIDNMNNISEENAIVGEDESEQKSMAGLSELLEEGFKEDDSVDRYIPLHCFIDEDVGRYTPKIRLSHEDASVVPDATLYSPREGASIDNNSSSLETELEVPSNSEKALPFKITITENFQSCEDGTSGTVFTSTDVETADQVTSESENPGEDDMVNKNGLDHVQNTEVTDNALSALEAELEVANNGEEEAAFTVTDETDNLQSCEGDATETVFTGMDEETAYQNTNEIENAGEVDMVNSDGLDPVANNETCLVFEVGNDHENQIEDDGVVEQSNEEGYEEVINEEEETAEVHDSVEFAIQSEIQSGVSGECEEAVDSESVQYEDAMETIETCEPEESEEVADCESAQDEMAMETVETSEPQETEEAVDSETAQDEIAMETVETCEPQESEEAVDSENVQDESAMEAVETSEPKESEEAFDNESAQGESTTVASEGMGHDELPPEDEKTECKEQTTSIGTVNTSNLIPDKPVFMPVRISGGSEAKPIIIAARIVKKDNVVTTETGDNRLVSDRSSLKSFRILRYCPPPAKSAEKGEVSDIKDKDNVSTTKSAESNTSESEGNTKSAEPENNTEFADSESNLNSAESGKTESESESNTKSAESEINTKSAESESSTESEENKQKSNESRNEETSEKVRSTPLRSNFIPPKIILTRKVYGNAKKKPLPLQGKNVPSTKTPNTDKEDNQNAKEDKERKTSPQKMVLVKKVGGNCVEEKETDFAAVKRKFEEVSRISRREEEIATKEIKKMKKETLDILKKINGEMEKFKAVFLAGN